MVNGWVAWNYLQGKLHGLSYNIYLLLILYWLLSCIIF